MSKERLGNVLSETDQMREQGGGRTAMRGVVTPTEVAGSADPAGGTDADPAGGADADPEAEAVEFVRFCYRRRAVAWPELYDEMCAVAARGDFRGMDYEQLQGLGIGFALSALPRLAELANRVIAQERSCPRIAAVA